MKVLKEIFSKESDISSKRIMGVTTLINAIVMSYVKPNENIIDSFLLTGAALLGVSIATEIASKVSKKDKGNEK